MESQISLCRIIDCGKPVKAKKLCAKHHQRLRRTGNVNGKNELATLKVVNGPIRDWPRKALEELLHEIKTKKTDIRISPQMSDEEGGIMGEHQSYGIVRKIDGLGRLGIPKEYGLFLGKLPGLPLEFFWDDHEQTLVLQVYNPGCYFCGSVANMLLFKERKICRSCIGGPS